MHLSLADWLVANSVRRIDKEYVNIRITPNVILTNRHSPEDRVVLTTSLLLSRVSPIARGDRKHNVCAAVWTGRHASKFASCLMARYDNIIISRWPLNCALIPLGKQTFLRITISKSARLYQLATRLNKRNWQLC